MSKKLLIKNSVTGAIQIILTTILTFLCIKLFMLKLGDDLYGIFSVITIIGNINIFTNLGLNYSLIKFLSEQGKQKESDYDVIVAIILLLILLVPVSAILIIFNKFVLINILNVPFANYGKSMYFYIFIVLSNLFILIGYTFNAVLDSQQKIYINNFLQLIYSTMYWGSILIVVWMGYSLFEVGMAVLFSSLIWFTLVLYYFYKYWGIPDFEGLKHNYSRIVKKQLSYSLKIYSSGAISFFYEPLTKVIISNFVGVAFVGYFDIALKIRTVFWSFTNKILYPLYPFIAKLQDENKISLIINDVQKKLLYAIIPLIVIIIFVTKPFITFWIGVNVDIISIGVISVGSSFMVNIVGTPNYQYLMTKRVSKTIVFQALNVITNILVFFVLYKYYGYYAVLVSFNLSMLITFLLTLYYQHKYLNSFIFDSLKYNLYLIALFVSTFSVAFIFDYFISITILKIILIPMIVFIISLLIFRYLRYFDQNDIDAYFKESKKLNYFLRKLFIAK